MRNSNDEPEDFDTGKKPAHYKDHLAGVRDGCPCRTVGDPVWYCTRTKGHDGKHEATIGGVTALAVWGDTTEDPHGWVSVDDRMPEDPNSQVEIWYPVSGNSFAYWTGEQWESASDIEADGSPVILVWPTHWRIPTPGPSSTGGE